MTKNNAFKNEKSLLEVSTTQMYNFLFNKPGGRPMAAGLWYSFNYLNLSNRKKFWNVLFRNLKNYFFILKTKPIMTLYISGCKKSFIF